MFADVVHNEAFEEDENEKNEKTENKCADLWLVRSPWPMEIECIFECIKTANLNWQTESDE